jgi:hypothetical protein
MRKLKKVKQLPNIMQLTDGRGRYGPCPYAMANVVKYLVSGTFNSYSGHIISFVTLVN